MRRGFGSPAALRSSDIIKSVMNIVSAAIDAHGQILPEHTPMGRNTSPALTFSQVPTVAQSLALIMDDPDAPGGTFTHWLLYDMPSDTYQIAEDNIPPTAKVGANDFGNAGYNGPQPPTGTHHYYFRLLALDKILNLSPGATRKDLDAAIAGHVIAVAHAVGTYTAKP